MPDYLGLFPRFSTRVVWGSSSGWLAGTPPGCGSWLTRGALAGKLPQPAQPMANTPQAGLAGLQHAFALLFKPPALDPWPLPTSRPPARTWRCDCATLGFVLGLFPRSSSFISPVRSAPRALPTCFLARTHFSSSSQKQTSPKQ